MIRFVQEGTGQQLFPGFLEKIAAYILGTNGHFSWSCDRLTKFRNAQAALILSLAAFGVNDLRIY